jgi:peptidoglycan/LPS O-acetylase OafA/YrhL
MRRANLIMPPGLFRVALAYAVFVNHSIPVCLGSAAVYLFFVLSGYWVYRMWQAEYESTSAPYLYFIISRFWRLLPIYYVALAVYILSEHILPSGRTTPQPEGLFDQLHFYFSHMLLIGYAPLTSKLILPVWSLDIELQFYLVAPFLILLLMRQGWTSPLRLAVYAGAVAGLAAFIVFYSGTRAQSAYLPMYLIFFLIGLHAAHYNWRLRDDAAACCLGIASALVIGIIAWPATRPLLVQGSFSGWLSDYYPAANIVIALVMAPYAIATVYKSPKKGTWLARFDRDLSNVTYEIYLLHWTAVGIVAHFCGHISKYDQLPAIMISWVAIFPAAWAIYWWIDRPIDNLRRLFVKSKAVTSTDNRSRVAPSTAPPASRWRPYSGAATSETMQPPA